MRAYAGHICLVAPVAGDEDADQDGAPFDASAAGAAWQGDPDLEVGRVYPHMTGQDLQAALSPFRMPPPDVAAFFEQEGATEVVGPALPLGFEQGEGGETVQGEGGETVQAAQLDDPCRPFSVAQEPFPSDEGPGRGAACLATGGLPRQGSGPPSIGAATSQALGDHTHVADYAFVNGAISNGSMQQLQWSQLAPVPGAIDPQPPLPLWLSHGSQAQADTMVQGMPELSPVLASGAINGQAFTPPPASPELMVPGLRAAASQRLPWATGGLAVGQAAAAGLPYLLPGWP